MRIEGTCTPNVVEVYIRNEEALTQATHVGQPLVAGYGGHWCTVQEIYKSQRVMPEADASVLKIAREFCKERGLRLRIYNISTLSGKMRARLKGVKKTPTILFGSRSLEGVFRKEELVSFVE